MALVVRGKGEYWAESVFGGRVRLRPDLERSRGEQAALSNLTKRGAAFFKCQEPPLVMAAKTTIPDHPQGEALVGFNVITVKDFGGQVAGWSSEWLVAHEMAHGIFSSILLNAFFAGRPDLLVGRRRLTQGLLDGSIDIQVNHWKLFDTLYKRYFSHEGVGTKGLDPLVRQWEEEGPQELFVPYSLVDRGQMGRDEKDIFNAYVLYTLIDMYHKEQTFRAKPELVEQICNYLACVAMGISIEDFARGPHATNGEREEILSFRGLLWQINDVFPANSRAAVAGLVDRFREEEINSIVQQLRLLNPDGY